MKRKRRHLTAEFKARIALEAIKGEKTAAEIARENDIAPAQISEWKKQLEERLGEVFQSKGERSKERQCQERKEARLERKIGQLVIEKDFLVKKCKQLGIDPNEKL
ncbi:MAG: transposase [Verrucomicrobiota bacterium]